MPPTPPPSTESQAGRISYDFSRKSLSPSPCPVLRSSGTNNIRSDDLIGPEQERGEPAYFRKLREAITEAKGPQRDHIQPRPDGFAPIPLPRQWRALQSGSPSHIHREEPLFLDADETDTSEPTVAGVDIQDSGSNGDDDPVFMSEQHSTALMRLDRVVNSRSLAIAEDRAMVSRHPPSPVIEYDLYGDLPPSRRRARVDDDDDVVYIGSLLPTDSVGPVRRKRRIETVEDSALEGKATPLREVSEGSEGCSQCGCHCQATSSAGRSRIKGSGSATLSPHVLGNILQLLLKPSASLRDQIHHTHPALRNWSDIALYCGAEERDFDRVRHAAKWMQDRLPDMKRKEAF